MNILKIDNLDKSFGGVNAITNLSFTVPSGGVYSIIGPNGAGKTTLFNMLCGFYKPSGGSIKYFAKKDYDLDLMATDKIAKCGISRTFQNLQIFFNMSVLENVLVGCHLNSHVNFIQALLHLPLVSKEEKLVKQKALEALEFCNLSHLANKKADALPYGDLKKLEIARALAARPQLIMLDEPAAGLNDTETRQMHLLIRKICDSGKTVLLVEHNMELIMNVSDEILVINFGNYLAHGAPQDIQNNPKVIEAYLGGEVA